MKNTINVTNSVRGEYRAILTGPDGKIKVDTGWHPNVVLLNGLQYMVRDDQGFGQYMAIGDSATPATESQIGLQGNFNVKIAGVKTGSGVLTAPLYGKWLLTDYVFDVGVGTGTINECVIAYDIYPDIEFTNKGTIRFVLNTTINKGAEDSLTIQHKFFMYQNVSDVSGVVDISGVSYDYTIRPFGILEHAGIATNDRMANHLRPPYELNGGMHDPVTDPAILDPITEDYPTLSTNLNNNLPDPVVSFSYGGDTNAYYCTALYVMDVDTWNYHYSGAPHTFDKMYGNQWRGGSPTNYDQSGLQFSFIRTSDGAPFDKENTHEFQISVRVTTVRYTP